MLVVKLEVHPGGDASQAYEIGRAEIANVSGLAPVSDYVVRVRDGEKWSKRFDVRSHRRDDGAWKLVLRALYGWYSGGEG